MKKIIFPLLFIFCFFTACARESDSSLVEDMLPLLIMVDDKLFQCYKEQEIHLEEPSTGAIEVVVYDEVPDKNNQATFGEVGMEYWLMDDEKLYVQFDDYKFFYFKLESEFQ